MRLSNWGAMAVRTVALNVSTLRREWAEPVRVAILDDDPSIRNAISRFLRTADIRVDTYASWTEFLDRIADNRADCLLLDLHMPEVDGIAVLSHLRYAKLKLPVIVISAEEETKFRDLCSTLGVTRYLRKPLNGPELLSAIDEAVLGVGIACVLE